ncbi:Ca2+-dependent phosphoinositide-specific phospholipase C [Vibrio rhizosphaerae]|uniref:Ca2+-dependent phosphoinositide-specific phospholipase C n=1 Tax=Vibrio rhizosphaerae TaxID=398736 RepID=UPI00068DB287|nr:Ca2+-dependent phosphoinositide-specific phospholipase C [Vibrio rhizosphaerae]
MKITRLTFVYIRAAFFLYLTLLYQPSYAKEFIPPFEASQPSESSRLDELYYIQPHNTYKNNGVLRDWLNAGYRAIELDVIDRGDWEDEAKGPYVAHGLNPMNANCRAEDNDRLGDCLDDIAAWMDNNPNALPLLIFVDMKSSWDPASAWKHDEVAELDWWISNYFGPKMFTYQELLTHLGNSNDYRETLKMRGWPTVSSLRGKAIVILTGGHKGDVNHRMEQAMNMMSGTQSTFLCPDIDAADASEFTGTIDAISATNSKRFFCGNVKAGDHYQVTANAASDTKQLMHLWHSAGDFANTDYAATWIAIAHGVSAIGWDISSATNTPRWIESIPLVGVRRSLPGYFTIRPSISTEKCLTVKRSDYSNGGDLIQEHCSDTPAQRFVYTAEGQLRPAGNNKYCVDFNTGSADNGDVLHLWDCDGGNSEKWQITSDGRFKNRDKDYRYCMDVPGATTSSGVQWKIYQCNGNENQKFNLRSVPDWHQSSF